jgi:mono/diheme cytochrome c family protein
MTPNDGLNRVPRRAPWRKRALQVTGIAAALIAIASARQPKSLGARAAADPTFAEDVAPILYKNCTVCHRPSGLGPFSLLEYDSAKKEASKMRDAVEAGQMPPWHAEGPRGTFRNDRRLSDAERGTILRWIDAGAQSGDMNKLPPRPEYQTKWTIGTPDATVTMPDEFVVPASGTVEYQYFEVPTNFTEDKWISAIEIMPGAREVVHHVLLFARVPATVAETPAPAPAAAAPATPGTAAPRPVFIRNRAQSQLPEAPRSDSRHGPPRQLGTLIGTNTPGNEVMEFPPGTALRVRAGTVLTFQMHYTAHGHEMKDRTTVGFRFAKAPPTEEMFASQFVNGSLLLPAGAKDVQVPAEITAGQPVKIWGIMPHTHLRGTRWQYKLENPDGTSEIILDVPHYDFNWQTYYMFAKPLEIQPGAKITSMAWYDNSATNKSNPDASKDVKWGDQTWEEMQYTGFLYSVPGRRVTP